MRNPIKHFCDSRNLAMHELASMLGFTSLDLYFAQARNDKYGSIRNAVAVFFGFECWSDLLAQARMDEARQVRAGASPGSSRMLMYSVDWDSRNVPEYEPRAIMFRYQEGFREAVLWFFDGRFYIDRSDKNRFTRVQRFALVAAEEEYRKAVKEITA